MISEDKLNLIVISVISCVLAIFFLRIFCFVRCQISDGCGRNFGPIGSGINHMPGNLSVGQSSTLRGGIGGLNKIVKAGNDFNGIKMVDSTKGQNCGAVRASQNGFDINSVSLVDWKISNNSRILDVTGSPLNPIPNRNPGDSLEGHCLSIGSLPSSVTHNLIPSSGNASSSSTGGSPYLSVYPHVRQHEKDHQSAITMNSIDQQVRTATSASDMCASLTSSLDRLNIREFIPGQLWTSVKSNGPVSSPKSYVLQRNEFTYGMVNDTWMAPENIFDSTSDWALNDENCGLGIANYTDGMYRYGWSLGNDKDETDIQEFPLK